jgi:2-iminobutanoate/2-iminopropanoate deaminase
VEGPAVKVPGLVFVAGQTSADPDTKKATRTVLKTLKKVLELAGSSMEQAFKYDGK